MNDATLQHFRDLAAAMQTEPQTWQWIGPHMSQRMFGIGERRAKDYAAKFGGEAREMPTVTYSYNRDGRLVACAVPEAK